MQESSLLPKSFARLGDSSMMRFLRHIGLGVALLGLGVTLLAQLASAALAENFPAKAISIVVPLAAGTGMDTIVRSYGDKLSQAFGKPVVVDNQPGASTMLAAANVARAAPDGYTLVVATVGAMAVNPGLYKKINYDPVNGFVPIAFYAKSPSVLLVNPKLPVETAADLFALAKKSSPPLDYNSPGIGSPHHLTMELLKQQLGLEFVHITYRSSTQALTDIVAGHVSVGFGEVGASLPLVQAGQLRALAVSTATRLPLMPDTPTIAEALNLPGFETVSWHILFAPKGTPVEVVDRLHQAMKTVMSSPEMKKQIADLGLLPLDTPSVTDIQSYIKSEQEKWSSLVKKLRLEGSL
jgi:putative tricarboxylic transport membrane protein